MIRLMYVCDFKFLDFMLTTLNAILSYHKHFVQKMFKCTRIFSLKFFKSYFHEKKLARAFRMGLYQYSEIFIEVIQIIYA